MKEVIKLTPTELSMWEIDFGKYPPLYKVMPQLLAAIYVTMVNYLSKEGDKTWSIHDVLPWMELPQKDDELTEEDKENRRKENLITKIQLSKRLYEEEKERREIQKKKDEKEVQ